MNLYHFTRWPTLNQLIDGQLIKPAPFSADDRTNTRLDELAQLGLGCVWFTTQVWSDNRFGSYGLRYGVSDIAPSALLDLGRHNGARCFLSTSPFQASWLASHLNLRLLQPTADEFAQVSNVDRIDVLATWAVPLSTDIEFVSGDRPALEDQANFAMARLLALALVKKDHRFDQALTHPFGFVDAAHNLWSQLTGNSASFAVQTSAVADPSSLLYQALANLVAGDRSAARATTQHIGDLQTVSGVLADVISAHFGSRLSGAEVIAG